MPEISVTEDEGIGDLQKRFEAGGGEFPGEEVRVGGIRLPESPHKLRGDLRRKIGVRVAAGAPGPVHPRQGEVGAPLRILHRQQRRKVVLLRVARLRLPARQPELPPQPPVPNHHQRVPPSQHKELRPDSEFREGHLRQHDFIPPRNVSIPETRLAGEDLDEAPVLGVVAGAAGGVGGEELVVDKAEGVEGDAVLGEEGEESVGRVVEEGGGEEATGGGDEGW